MSAPALDLADPAVGNAAIVFTDPQVASVGLTEAAARATGMRCACRRSASSTCRALSSPATPAALSSSSPMPAADGCLALTFSPLKAPIASRLRLSRLGSTSLSTTSRRSKAQIMIGPPMAAGKRQQPAKDPKGVPKSRLGPASAVTSAGTNPPISAPGYATALSRAESTFPTRSRGSNRTASTKGAETERTPSDTWSNVRRTTGEFGDDVQ
jgi:Pyridine nucleotide-disulphide oxidoreductase, dimerisation domain